MANEKTEKKKIAFIVEDDLFLLKAYHVKLKKEGIEIWTATDGKEALTYLSKEPPNIVLLDIMLPEATGFEVLEQIRKNEKWKNVPVLILSNLGQEEDIKRGKQLGAVDYVIKANVKINQVVELVKKYIR